jgi:hypothetical protein
MLKQLNMEFLSLIENTENCLLTAFTKENLSAALAPLLPRQLFKATAASAASKNIDDFCWPIVPIRPQVRTTAVSPNNVGCSDNE